MNELIDNTELNEVMNILENLEDEVLAVALLKEFNRATKELGLLVVNKDQNLSHAEWKDKCDKAQQAVNSVVSEIKDLA